jgi:hypothetical protein
VYLELRGEWAGTITSSDPRLTGRLEFRAEPALVNVVTGFGTFRGRFRVSDPATGRQTARGEFRTVVTDANLGVALNHGFALGNVMSQGTGPSEDFFANFKSTLDAALNVSGEVGGAGDPRTPAVVQSGHCDGPFTRTP